MPVFAVLCLATLLIGHPAGWTVHLVEAAGCVICAFLLATSSASPNSRAQWIAGSCLVAAASAGPLQNLLHTSAVPADTWYASLQWGTLAAVFLAVSLTARRHSQQDRFLNATACFGIAICLLAMAQFYTSGGKLFWLWPGPEPRVLGPFLSRNNYASFALLMLPITLWKALENKGPSTQEIQWQWLSAAAAIYASIIASGSRAGALLATTELPVFFLLARRRSGRAAAAFVILAIAAVGVSGWGLLGTKITDDDPLRYRKEMIRSALDMARQKPVTGWGLGVYPAVYPRFAYFDSGHFVNHAHNDWAEWAAEGGLPLTLALGVFAATSLTTIRRRPWVIGLAAVYLHALVDYPMQRLGVAVWVVALAALALGHQKSASSGHAAASVTL